MGEGDTLLNAAIGVTVAIVLSFLLGPASPVLGGVAAGCLQGGDTRPGAAVGTVALAPFLPIAGPFTVVGVTPLSAFSRRSPSRWRPAHPEESPSVAGPS